MNLPICGTATILVLAFLKLRRPTEPLLEKLSKIDYMYVFGSLFSLMHLIPYFRSGNAIISASTTSTMLGLTWGGNIYPWNSAKVLIPLILGLCGIIAFLFYEAKIPKEPIVSYFGYSGTNDANKYYSFH